MMAIPGTALRFALRRQRAQVTLPPVGRGATWLAALAIACLAGCGEDLENYGERDKSLNGVSVLAKMFASNGGSVRTGRALSPRVSRADTIVWFATSRELPSEEVIDWFESWLGQDQRPRTLIYVRRDYDAAAGYWQSMAPRARSDLKSTYEARAQTDRLRTALQRAATLKEPQCAWFQIEPGEPREAESFEGPMAHDIDAAKTGVRLHDRLTSSEDFETELSSDDDEIVSRAEIDSGSVVLVANGSFLLNEPLVRPENRKLAGRLIEMTNGSDIVFLECYGDPRILDHDPEPTLPHSLAALGVWPLNVVLLHLAVVGILFCFARWPIRGRPQRLPPVDVGNFANHARALGKLFERAGAIEYAERRLSEYRQGRS